MRNFKFILSIYFLPVFFFTLAVSPNISGDRIGVVLLSVFILLIPAANYIAVNPNKRISPSGDIKYSFIDSLSLIMLIAAIYLGWQISWQFILIEVVYLLAVVLISNKERYLSTDLKWFVVRVLVGILLFAIIYLGLNQYGFNNLLRIHIVIFASLSTLIILISLYIENLRQYYILHKDVLEDRSPRELKPVMVILILSGLLLLTFAGFFITTYHWHYAGYFALALLPAFIIIIGLFGRIKTTTPARMAVALSSLNIILSISLVVFFIYFFLDSTQVLQAIRGGY